MRMHWMILAATWGALAGPAFAGPLTFEMKGTPTAAWEQAEVEQKTAPVEVEIWEPHEKRNVRYRGFAFQSLLAAAYGDAWKKQEEILFTCSDGYQPSVPVERFLSTPSYLVFERVGSPSFELTDTLQGNQKVSLGPYYLVWDNASDPEKEIKGANGWPYQVEKVDLVRFADRFPQMAPPPGSDAKTVAGFNAFRENCAKCHSVNGDGGLKGMELNYPVSVAEYFKQEWLKQWILDPSTMRLRTSMPALPHEWKNRSSLAENIVAYLETMSKHKQAPKESAP